MCGVLYAAALGSFFLHALNSNPQYDTQVLWDANSLAEANTFPELISQLMAPRKYPLFAAAPFAVALKAAYTVLGELPQSTAYAIGRGITLAFAVGSLLVLRRIARRWPDASSAVVLMMGSILFFEFSTAIRPHIPLTFWTLLSLLYALRARETRNAWDTAISFVAAAAAFCTLQNGIFAFLFPTWALMTTTKERPFRYAQTLAILGAALGACLVVGYPWLIVSSLYGTAVVDLTLGHQEPLRFSLLHSGFTLSRLLGSEALLIILASAQLIYHFRNRRNWQEPAVIIIAYIALYLAVFGFYATADGRYFIVTLPLLSLFAAQAYARLPAAARTSLIVLICLMLAKFAFLGASPNTFQLASDFLRNQPGKFRSVGYPEYFFDLPTERVTPKDELGTNMSFVVAADAWHMEANAAWEVCASFRASRTSDATMLLWVETPLALFHLFEAERLGPNLTVFCKR